MLKRQLAIDYHDICGGVLFGPDRCAPLGRNAVSLLLSAFRVTGRSSFLRLSRQNRHHIVAMVMQHSTGMRFDHFPARAYLLRQFLVNDDTGDISLTTDWHRYSGRRRYRLRFPMSPKRRSRWYSVYAPSGEFVTHLAAATIMSWHFAQLRASREQTVFAPDEEDKPSRASRQAWLRRSLRSALPTNETRAIAMIEDVTPHSFRPGLAGDLLAEGASLEEIGLECRWQGRRIVRMYAERMSLGAARVSTRFRVIRWQ